MLRSFLLAIPLLTAAQAADSLSGKWQVHRNAAGRESTQECTFVQSGTELSGSCGVSAGGTAPLKGKIDGKQVTWTLRTESEGGAVTIVYAGTLESASRISGRVTAVEFGVEGDFTASPSR